MRKLSTGSYPPRVAFSAREPFLPAAGTVAAVEERANSARIDVMTSGRAFLVTSVTSHEYWRVTIDGTPVQPIVTNVGYQGVIVPAGRRRVEMTYRSHTMVAGGVITVIALTLLTTALIVGRRRGRAVS